MSTPTPSGKRSPILVRRASLASEELKYKRKYRDLKKKVRGIELETERLTVKLRRMKRETVRLRVERRFLHEKLEQGGILEEPPTSGSDSEELLVALATAAGFSSTQGVVPGSIAASRLSNIESLASTNAPSLPNDEAAAVHATNGGSVSVSGRGGRRGGAHASERTPQRRGRRGGLAGGTPTGRRSGGGPGSASSSSIGGNANPFFAFCQKERAKVRTLMPDASNGEVTRELGQRWRALTSAERQSYYALVEKQRAERLAQEQAAAEARAVAEAEILAAAQAAIPTPSLEAAASEDSLQDVTMSETHAGNGGVPDAVAAATADMAVWSDTLSTSTSENESESEHLRRMAHDDDEDEEVDHGEEEPELEIDDDEAEDKSTVQTRTTRQPATSVERRRSSSSTHLDPPTKTEEKHDMILDIE